MSPINYLFVARDVDASATSSDSVSDVPEPTSSSPSFFNAPPPPNIPGWVGWLVLAIFVVLLMVVIHFVYKESTEYTASLEKPIVPTRPSELSPNEKRRLSLGKVPRPIIAPPLPAHIAAAKNAAHTSCRVKPDMIAPPLPPIRWPASARCTRKKTRRQHARGIHQSDVSLWLDQNARLRSTFGKGPPARQVDLTKRIGKREERRMPRQLLGKNLTTTEDQNQLNAFVVLATNRLSFQANNSIRGTERVQAQGRPNSRAWQNGVRGVLGRDFGSYILAAESTAMMDSVFSSIGASRYQRHKQVIRWVRRGMTKTVMKKTERWRG
ncbi:hypothetical protein B0H16DRAFT_1449684 [Mycena metata]|uniref:Uncharacterized protein n=1 Tax=Mycena metata TaxID=1033252 RepID=A0AAD7K194_9AGAR|nr:hypothetical protein B0H16DRAFT_1449684 [Mycena metata]